MRQGHRVEKKEWFLLLRANPFEHVRLNQILRIGFANAFAIVAGQIKTLVVVVEIGWEITVRVPLAIVAEEMVETFFQRTAGRVEHSHAPFSHARRRVTCVFENLRDGHRLGR